MIVATALVLVVVVYLCKKHRTKRQMERVFKVRPAVQILALYAEQAQLRH